MAIYKETKRITALGLNFEKITFSKPSIKYLVKNFSSNDIYVSFKNDATTDDSSKIASNMYQVCSQSVWENPYTESDTGNFVDVYTNFIYVKGTGEIEITQI